MPNRADMRAFALGLWSEDNPYILPCVDKKVPSSPQSSLKFPNTKIPSYCGKNGACGFANWTEHETSDIEILMWMNNPNHGFGVHTKYIRAIDIDIEDSMANEVSFMVEDTLNVRLPVRGRKLTPEAIGDYDPIQRRALLFRMKGEMPYRVIKTAKGNIEFAGNGRFMALQGAHYDKNGFHDSDYHFKYFPKLEEIPEITHEQYEDLCRILQKVFGKEDMETAEKHANSLQLGEITPYGRSQVAYLESIGAVIKSKSEVEHYVECPWQHEHTIKNSDNDAMFIAANALSNGGFKCMHSHCANRNGSDYLAAVGFTGTEFEPPEEVSYQSVEQVQQPSPLKEQPNEADPKKIAEVLASLPLQRAKNGRILASIPNVCMVLRNKAVSPFVIAFDEFDCKVKIKRNFTNEQFKDFRDSDYTRVRLALNDIGFMELSLNSLRECVHFTADNLTINSAKDWLNSLTWDGYSRIDEMVDALGARPTKMNRAVCRYIMTAMAGRMHTPGVKVDMIPVLIAAQGVRKSTFIEMLAPQKNWAVTTGLDVHDADIARKTVGKCIVELPELKGMRSKDLDAIKAWVTTKEDTWIPKYSEYSKTVPRAWIAIGSENKCGILADPTGNRRWIPMEVGETRSKLDVEWLIANRDQLWAEGLVMFKEGGIAYSEVEEGLPGIQDKFKVVDAWEQPIARYLEEHGYDVGVNEAATCVLGIPVAQISGQIQWRIQLILQKLKTISLQKKSVQTESSVINLAERRREIELMAEPKNRITVEEIRQRVLNDL